jgi:hypothetical protein
MSKLMRPSLLYFAIVLGTGFMLGMFRVPVLVPRIGERWAELAEMPIMAAVIFMSAGCVLGRFPAIRTPGLSLATGGIALALSVAAELGMAMLLQQQSLVAYIKSRDPVSGAVYVGLLLVFAVMPRLRLRGVSGAEQFAHSKN